MTGGAMVTGKQCASGLCIDMTNNRPDCLSRIMADKIALSLVFSLFEKLVQAYRNTSYECRQPDA
jgi:hypothetical protein